MSFAGMMSDMRKSAARLYINNFIDAGRQNTMDILLVWVRIFGADLQGRMNNQKVVELYDPISDYVNSQLDLRSLFQNLNAHM